MNIDRTVSAVITGGASGLGEATARRLAAAGARVAIFDRNAQRGEQVARDIGARFFSADVCSDEEVELAFGQARAAHGQERILVCCAGIGAPAKTASRDKKSGEIKHFPLESFQRVIEVNLLGTFRCVAKSAAGMLSLAPLEDSGERGTIVLTSSIAASDGQVGQAAYSASKAAIVGMTLPIARDLMNEGIRVNTILPGIFDTPLMNSASEPVKAALAASIPFPKRLGHPDEYARLALEMITNEYLNAENVRLDAGLRMAPR